MSHNVLFRTVHGSRLYGLSHEGSDYDYYTVVEKVKTKRAKFSTHSVVDTLDSVVVDFGTWVDQCVSGVPQALEAMFAGPEHVIIDEIGQFRSGYVAGTGVWARYMRTIKSFAYSEKDPYKRKRHALRLGINLNEMAGTGRFNPTLTPSNKQAITKYAELPDDFVYGLAKFYAWYNREV